MPIFDQGYQHWQGKLSGHALRWLTITRHGVRVQLKSRPVRLLMLLAWVPALGLAVVLIIWGLLEQKSAAVMPLVSFLNLPPEVMAGPKAFRVSVWTLAYYGFFEVEMFFCMLLVAIVGPSLVSQDLRFNALPLYFSRPLRRIDYFIGKLGVIGYFLGAVAIAPAVMAYVLGLLFSLDFNVIKDTARLLLASVAYGLVVVVSAGTLMLALSSLSRNSRYVAAFWVGLWLISGSTATVLTGINADSAQREVYQRQQASMPRPGTRVTPADAAAYDRLREEMQEARAEAMRNDWRPMLAYTNNLKRIGTALLGTDEAFEQFTSLIKRPGRRKTTVSEMSGPQNPWYWSAGVLAGLMGISLWILTSRVKSLDRLR